MDPLRTASVTPLYVAGRMCTGPQKATGKPSGQTRLIG